MRRRRLGTLATLDAGTMTLDRFVADVWAPQRAADLKPATRTFYAGLYRAHIAPTFADVPLRDISPQRVAAWQAERVKAGAGRTAIREALSLVGGILGYAVELEHVQVNAARAVRPVRRPPRKTGRALSVREVEARRGAVDEGWSMLVTLLAYTGMRPGEALALRWGDLTERTIRVERAASMCDGSVQGTKTDTSRSVRLLAPLAADLAAWRLRCGRPAKTALVVPHPSGQAWSKTHWDNWRDRVWRPAAHAAGIATLEVVQSRKDARHRKRERVKFDGPVPYDLRHTFASLLLAEGRSVHYVAEQLGHGAEQTLRTYGHVIADYRDRQVIDAEAEIRAVRSLAYPSRTLRADDVAIAAVS
ncbi:MAG TPA: tyrosine-type recombinase/integrase [Baekduia sp.]|nr:tyrosine-type recombinase/integrase [Baekduia sp.]